MPPPGETGGDPGALGERQEQAGRGRDQNGAHQGSSPPRQIQRAARGHRGKHERQRRRDDGGEESDVPKGGAREEKTLGLDGRGTFKWDLKNDSRTRVAPGLYVIVIDARSVGGDIQRTITKLAIE
jgi:hypothetical protein